MALTYSTTNKRKKVPVKRNSKFFGHEDFDLEIGFATEYLEQDANQTVILYRVDLSKTKVSDIYVESQKDDIKFLPPIELPVIYEVSDADLRSYNKNMNKGVYSQNGILTFSVLLSTLEEYGCDISRGDYIGVQITPEQREYYTVIDDGRVASTANRFTIFGTLPYARTIKCSVVDINEFNG